jgi:DUF1680 family protein
MVELGRATGNRRYIDQALYFLDARGYGLVGGDEYHQDHVPFREATTVVGHAVRQVYFTAGAADIYAETGDQSILEALNRLWDNMTQRRIYVSSGIGSRWEGESFGKDLELPNSRAYTESCAAIGSIMWNWRMLAITGDAKYADLIETTLYNAMLPGISLSGDLYFYQNPLADQGVHRREPWFDCACCPPNLARTLASITGYLATTSEPGIWLHLYAASQIDTRLPSGQQLRLTQHTDYPWDGDVRIDVESSGNYSLFLRIPGWCGDGVSATVNDRPVAAVTRPGSYLEIAREWSTGDVVRLCFPMPVTTVLAHPDLFENTGRVAVFRGPILYCLEQAGNGTLDPKRVSIPEASAFAVHRQPELLGGVNTLTATASTAAPSSSWADRLYQPASASLGESSTGRAEITLIPYFAWANREPGPMEVWLKAQAP